MGMGTSGRALEGGGIVGLFPAWSHWQMREGLASFSLSQSRNRSRGGCMLCEPDLVKYIRKTFLIMNALMKE